MKVLSTLFLSIVILAQSVLGTLVVVHYQANKKYITQALCENRNLPSKGCQGKCYLKKQLKKAEEAEKTLPSTIKEKMEVLYTISCPLQISFSQSYYIVRHYTAYTFFLPEGSSFFDPHPPQA